MVELPTLLQCDSQVEVKRLNTVALWIFIGGLDATLTGERRRTLMKTADGRGRGAHTHLKI